MTQSVCSEVYSILNMLGNDYIDKLPQQLFDFIISQKETSYNPTYSLDTPIDKQNISEDALAIITFFNLKYWCDATEKEEITRILIENEKQYKASLFNQNINAKQQSTNNIVNVEKNKKEIAIVPVKESFKQKIFNIIKRIFNR